MIYRSDASQHTNTSDNKVNEDYPRRSKIYPRLEAKRKKDSRIITRIFLLLFFTFSGWLGILQAQNTSDTKTAVQAFEQLFEATNVSNLPIYWVSNE